jgi:hypothetical protein
MAPTQALLVVATELVLLVEVVALTRALLPAASVPVDAAPATSPPGCFVVALLCMHCWACT